MDKYVLVKYPNTVNSAICETFQNTQRIKLLSFEVSNQYIILGTSSGGIYIFRRKPCEFLRLIPSKEGPTILIKISQDEKNLAVSTSKGLIIILQNYFLDFNIRPFLYTEHESNIVTVMTWHGNDLYCGDSSGKISVCTVLFTLTQAIFQCPSAMLMHLDSSIVQIDAFKNYLLISTKTRTYLCDTEKEQYKQIGKKLRDGNFGACFSQTDVSDYLHQYQGARNVFKTLEEQESFTDISKLNDLKIYCSRPGARLWVVNFEASVLTTNQFRHSLNQLSSNLIIIDDDKESRLNILKVDSTEISKTFNLGKLFPIYPNILLTYDKHGIYFFNIETSSLLCWTHIFKNIKDLRILKPYIYIWQNDLEINIVSLYSLEELILSTLLNKQYFLCADICKHFNQEILKLVEKSKKMNLLTVLETKLKNIGNKELLDKVKNILVKLNEYYGEQKLGIKLENGVVMVNNQYLNKNLPVVQNQILNISSTLDENLKIINKQYILNKIHKVAELSESSKILNNLQLNDLYSLLKSFMKYVNDKNNEDASFWCKQQMVKLASKKYNNLDSLDTSTIDFLTTAFFELNNFQKDSCKCKFPLPLAHTRKVEHFDLGCKLYEHSNSKDIYLYNIPSLIRHKISTLKDITSNIPLLIQFCDKDIIKKHLNKFTYDTWEEILKLFVKLQKGHCTNCNEKIPVDGILSWTEMSLLIVESMGAKNTTRLLKRYSQFIPRGKLDIEFYQSCIFSLTCEDRGLGVQCIEGIKSAGNLKKFGDNLEKFLQRKYICSQSQAQSRPVDHSLVCSYCRLPINNAVLVDFKKCECGLLYHQICFPNNNICTFCVSVSTR